MSPLQPIQQQPKNNLYNLNKVNNLNLGIHFKD